MKKQQLFNSVPYLSHELQSTERRSTRMADDPPYLTVGTEVSAKYKGAFCEAKIRKVVRVVKCKVTFKGGHGSHVVADDQIRGNLRLGSVIEAKHPEKNQFIEATINKIQDSSQYTVVFDDGDITTLRRSALCLKSGRHFNESETLDQLPLTHPEHFSNPVVGGRRGVRRRAADKDDSSEEEDEEIPPKRDGKKKIEKEMDMGKVVCVESTDKKKSKDTWFPALIVSPSAQETVKIRIKDEYLVRSFRDGRYYTVPKKEISDFTKESKGKYDSNSNVLRSAVEKAQLFLEKNELPPHWDRDVLFGSVRQSESGEGEEQSESEVSEDDPRNEEKDRFIAQLYKFMDDRSTPLNKVPQVCNKDLDLHKLFKIVTGKGGYTKVTNQGQWKAVTLKLGYGNMPSTSTINLVKQAYKKCLFNFEEFYRKLGCTWTPRSTVGTSSKSRSSRSIFRERGTPAASSSRETIRDKKEGDDSDGRATPSSSRREAKEKSDKDKSSQEEKEKASVSQPEEDSPPPGDTGSESSDVKQKADPPEEIRKSARGRQPKKDRDAEESASPSASSRKKRQTTASRDRDRDSSVASSTKDEGSTPSTPSSKDKDAANSSTPTTGKKTGGTGVGRGKYKRHGSKGATEPEEKEPPPKEEEKPVEPTVTTPPKTGGIEIRLGDKLQVYYPKSEGKTYEAKVIDMSEERGVFLVHYTGWNNRYDEWIDKARVSVNITLKQEQSGDDGSKSTSSSSSGNQSGPGAKTPGAKQRKGRNSTSTTSTTSASSGTTPTPPQPSTPSTTRSGKAAAAAASAASLSSSPVSGKRRRSTSSEVIQATPPPKRRRTRQKSGQGTANEQASESEPETSDSDGRSIKSEKNTSDTNLDTKRSLLRKDSTTPTPTSKKGLAGAVGASTEEESPLRAEKQKKSDKRKSTTVAAMDVDDDDEMSSSSMTSTKSKETGKSAPLVSTTSSAAAVVDDSKESSSSSSTSGSGGQVIDLDQIRSEMKGLDKIMKGSTAPAQSTSSVSSPAPPTLAAVGSSPPLSSGPSKVDIYEFQEDASDETTPAPIASTAPKLKMFSPVARSSNTTPEKEKGDKGPVTVSASSVEAVAKLGTAQDLPEKVPLVAIEKMEKDKDKSPSKSSTPGSNLKEAAEPSSTASVEPTKPLLSTLSSPTTTGLTQSVKDVGSSSKVTPGKSLLTAVTSTPVIVPSPVTTTSTKSLLATTGTPPPPPLLHSSGSGGAQPATSVSVSSTPVSSVISSVGATSTGPKGKLTPPVKAPPLPTPPIVVGSSTKVMPAVTSPLSSLSSSHPPPPPLLTPSSVVVPTPSTLKTSSSPSVVAATISPSAPSKTIASITSPPPPVLQLQHRPPLSTPPSTGMTPFSTSTPERPVLTPVVAASVSKVDSKAGPTTTTQFKKQDLFPHLIQHSPADPSSLASIPTISIVSAKPSTAEIHGEGASSGLSSTIPSQQQLKIVATIPPPPPVVVKPPPPIKPVYGSMGLPGSESPPKKKKKIKVTPPGPQPSTTPVKTLAPLPTVGAPPPPPVVISTMSSTPITPTITPTPGRKTPVKKRIPPPMDSPGKPIKPLGMGLAGPPSKPGKMNPEAMNAAIASVGATPTPTTISVPTTVITPNSTMFQTHHGSPGVLFATNTSSLANQPPPPPVNLLKTNQPAPIKSSSESIAASIAAVASMGSTMTPNRVTTPATVSNTIGKLSFPVKRFMKETSEKSPARDKVYTITGGPSSSSLAHLSQALPPPPIVIGKSSSSSEQTASQQQPPPPPHQAPPPAITIQPKFQSAPHTMSGGSGLGSNLTFVKATPPPPVSTGPGPGPGQSSHHVLDSQHHHPPPPPPTHHQMHPKTNLPNHPVIIIPAAPVVIKQPPYQHQQQQQQSSHFQPVIVPKPVSNQNQMEMQGQGQSPQQTFASHSQSQPPLQHQQQPHHQQQQQQLSSVMVSSSSAPSPATSKPMLPITVTPTNMQQVSNMPPVSIHSLSNIPSSNMALNRGNNLNLPAVELKPVISLTSTSNADLPASITVTKATTVMKSISPDIVAVSSSYSTSMSMKSNTSSSSTTVYGSMKQEDRRESKEPEIVMKPAPASAQIIFQTETKKTPPMEPIQMRQQPPPPPVVLQQKQEVKEQEENSLLCEEIIPGSPTAGDVEDKADVDVKDVKKEDTADKSKIEGVPLLERGGMPPGAVTPPSSSGGTTPSVTGSGKPVIVLGPKYGEDVLDDDRIGFELDERRMPKFGMDDDDDDNKMMDDRSVDSPMGPPSEGREADLQFRDSFSDGGGDHSPPSSPSTASTISSDDDSERRHDTSRLSPTPEGGSSKSKDSDDDDMDSDVGSKSTHLDDADSKHGSTRGSTRIRNQTSRLGRSPSPPMNKRRRIMRRKSPEEGRYIGRTIRTSSGRKITPAGRHGGDCYIEKEKEVKQPPPPPPVNLAKPPKTGRYNFIPNLNGMQDAEQRITLISQAINDLKEQYQKTKNEAASFERRVKRWKRRVREKERLARQEATKAAS